MTTAPGYLMLPVADIDRNPDQPRQHFSQDALDELATSICKHGVLQPIVVRPTEADRPYVLVAGERRWRAAQQAGLTELPARVLEEMDELEAYVLSVSENVNRKDMTLMEEARAYGKLTAAGKTPGEVAQLFGKTEAYVTWRMGLLGLIDDCADMVASGQMGPTLGYYVAKLSPAGQQMVSAKHVRGEFTTEQEACDFARAVLDRESQTVAFFDELGEPESDEEKAERNAASKRAKQQVDRLLRLSETLAELARLNPDDLARTLAGEVAAYTAKVELVTSRALDARRVTRKAKACAATSNITLGSE